MRLERQYRNPPPAKVRTVVEGLRGGATILMVAAFEAFLRGTLEEHVSRIVSIKKTVVLDDLPESMRVHSVFTTLKWATDGPPFGAAGTKKDRLTAIDSACRTVVAKALNPKVFTATGGNPGPSVVKQLCKQADLDDIFGRLRQPFERRWGKQEASSFVSDKLAEIVNRRHSVAHAAQPLNISRASLRESIRFLRALATVLDQELTRHIRGVINTLP